jgi:biopolymer transport protein ExbD
VALGNRKNRSKKFSPPKLMLTSMMDMFTIVLIFLLFSFSKETEKLRIAKDIQLPSSSAQTSYSDSIKVVLSSKELRLNDEVLAILDQQNILGLDPENPKASSLFHRLNSLREETVEQTSEEPKDRHILFLCDKRHSFKMINTVIKTAGMAGYPNFQFAVLEGRKD